MQPFESMSVDEIAEAIAIPLERWPGNCTWVALAMRRAGLVTAELANGQATFVAEAGDAFHSWLKMPDGRIVDPLRYRYEGVSPYVYIGPQGPEYVEQLETEPDARLRQILSR